MNAAYLALGAIALWASVAALGVSLAHVPPFLLTGISLLVGSAIALPLCWRDGRLDLRALRVSPRALLLGVYGLFGYHLLLFMALRTAPPVEANLVNYLWPLLIVVLAPLVLPGVRLRVRHVGAAVVGFGGAALAILGGARPSDVHAAGTPRGYLFALGAAIVWSTYSLASKRAAAVPTTALGSVAALSGLLSLLCHVAFEARVALSAHDVALLAWMGLGPLGAAFFLWDAALKRGEAATIGLLSFLTPLLSTTVLLVMRRAWPGPHVLVAAALIVGAALVGTRPR
jgi:drug/metabolite transporter (DMT)-like permease